MSPGLGDAMKSTTDRSVPLALQAVRLWFAVESRIAPDSAERRAAKMFVTPPRQKIRASRHNEATTPLRAFDVGVRDGSLSISATAMGDGPTVMLLHGWGGTAADMLPAASAFALAGHRAIVFDMPGHGRSPG